MKKIKLNIHSNDSHERIQRVWNDHNNESHTNISIKISGTEMFNVNVYDATSTNEKKHSGSDLEIESFQHWIL